MLTIAAPRELRAPANQLIDSRVSFLNLLADMLYESIDIRQESWQEPASIFGLAWTVAFGDVGVIVFPYNTSVLLPGRSIGEEGHIPIPSSPEGGAKSEYFERGMDNVRGAQRCQD